MSLSYLGNELYGTSPVNDIFTDTGVILPLFGDIIQTVA